MSDMNEIGSEHVEPMDDELRAELDRIEQFLMGPKGHMLAYVLSALRGPDEPSRSHQKAVTTVHIRAAAFPRLAKRVAVDRRYGFPGSHTALPVSEMWAFPNGLYRYQPPSSDRYPRGFSSHFEDHINSAAKYLGLPFQRTYGL